MKTTKAFERLNETVKNSIREMVSNIEYSCKLSEEAQIIVDRLRFSTYLEALEDCGVLNADEQNELYEVSLQNAKEYYNKRFFNK